MICPGPAPSNHHAIEKVRHELIFRMFVQLLG